MEPAPVYAPARRKRSSVPSGRTPVCGRVILQVCWRAFRRWRFQGRPVVSETSAPGGARPSRPPLRRTRLGAWAPAATSAPSLTGIRCGWRSRRARRSRASCAPEQIPRDRRARPRRRGAGARRARLGRNAAAPRDRARARRRRGACTRIRSGARCSRSVHAAAGGLAIEGYEMLKGLDGVPTHEHREWLPIVDNDQDMRAAGRRRPATCSTEHRRRARVSASPPWPVHLGRTTCARPSATSRFSSSCSRRSDGRSTVTSVETDSATALRRVIMALVKIPAENRTHRPSAATSRAFLAGHGIDYERWTPTRAIAADAPAEAVLAAYADKIDAAQSARRLRDGRRHRRHAGHAESRRHAGASSAASTGTTKTKSASSSKDAACSTSTRRRAGVRASRSKPAI